MVVWGSAAALGIFCSLYVKAFFSEIGNGYTAAAAASIQPRSKVPILPLNKSTGLQRSNSFDFSNMTLYQCGHRHGMLAEHIFPEITQGGALSASAMASNTSSSLLFHGMFGRCSVDVPWMERHWHGKALLLNGEHPSTPHSNGRGNLIDIGPLSDSEHSVHVIFAAQALIGRYPSEWWGDVFNASRKPANVAPEDNFLVYAASNCVEFRDHAAKRLQEINPHGTFRGGNCGGQNMTKLPARTRRNNRPPERGIDTWVFNRGMFSHFRFCLVMENENSFGYVTEKILNAFLGGCIPIYYGTEEIFGIFNADAFVYYDVENPQPAIDRVKYLESNRTAYYEILKNEPILAKAEGTIDKYFSLVDGVGEGSLKRKIRELASMPH